MDWEGVETRCPEGYDFFVILPSVLDRLSMLSGVLYATLFSRGQNNYPGFFVEPI